MKRVIARLDIKGSNVIKGIHLEGLKVVGLPSELSMKYASDGADEIFFQDTVASLYQRNNLHEIIEKVASNINIPLTVGGGIRTISDIEKVLVSGADKISINTKFVEDISFVKKAVKVFGSQAIGASIESKMIGNDWFAFTNNGRINSGKKIFDWILELQDNGVGELIVTSVDYEGTKKGFDLKLLEKIDKIIKIPTIFSGGAGSFKDIKDALNFSSITGVAIASLLHLDSVRIYNIKKNLFKKKHQILNINIKRNKNKLFIYNTKICNLKSLYNSVKKICDVEVIDSIKIDKNVDRLILPGVGSFSELSKELEGDKKNEICFFASKNKPLLGICLGAQILFTSGFENGKNLGLNLINGDVKSIDTTNKNKNLKIPNIGWFPILSKKHQIFKNIDNNSEMYFIHSYNFIPKDKNIIFGKITDTAINAICIQKNIIAVQFHPEKSGLIGMKFIENFSNLTF